MYCRPPGSTPLITLFPYRTLFRSLVGIHGGLLACQSPAKLLRTGWATLTNRANKSKASRRGMLLAKSYRRVPFVAARGCARSEEHTSEIQSLMRSSYAVFGLTIYNPNIAPKTTNTTMNNKNE